MKVNWSKLLGVLKTSPALFLGFLGVVAKNPSFVPDLIATEKTGAWVPFLETHTAVLLPLLNQIVTAMESNPQLLTDVLGALVDTTAAAAGMQ